MDAQTVFYLTDAPEATEAFLQELEYGLSDAFQAFCREHFTFEDPLDYPELRLVAVRTPEALDAALFHAPDERHFLSEDGCHCCLFLLDDELAGRPVFDYRLDGLTLPRWFLTYFPGRRVSAEDGLKHEYFRETPLPIDPSMFPTWPAKSQQQRVKPGTRP